MLAIANRTRTHDLLITFGPAFKPGKADVAFSSHQAQEIGIAVSAIEHSVHDDLESPGVLPSRRTPLKGRLTKIVGPESRRGPGNSRRADHVEACRCRNSSS